MTLARIKLAKTLGLAVLAAALLSAGANVRADEYGDVNGLLRSGKLPEALSKADQYLATKPKDPQMRFLKGVIQTESGRANDAIGTFSKLTEDYPELPEPYNNLAVLYAGQAQFDKARAALEMAIRTNPSYATAHENLGDVYAKLASQAYSRALQLDAGNTGVQPKLALIRELFSAGPRGTTVATRGGSSVAAAPAVATPAAAPTRTTVVAAAPAPAPAPAPRMAQTGGAIGAPAPSTPVAAPQAAPAPAPAAAVAPAADGRAVAKDVEAALQAWAGAWAAKDMSGYLAAYGREFNPPGSQSRKAWEEDRRARIVGKSKISVKISDMDVKVSGNKATARFRQAYSADALNVTSRKTLELVKSGERWTIVRESTG